MAQEVIVSKKEGPATAVEAAAGLTDLWWRRLLFVPTIGLLLLLSIVPLLFSLGISLFNYSIGAKPIWLGLGNYANMFTDPQFWLATKVTVQFTVAAVSIEVVLGILLGFVMNQRFTGMGIVRLIVFLPMMLAPFVVGLFWRFMFDQTFGVIDYLLTRVGLPAIPWLISPYRRGWAGGTGGALRGLRVGAHGLQGRTALPSQGRQETHRSVVRRARGLGDAERLDCAGSAGSFSHS
jgi:ABC-type polysaccharide transport system permease subunit